MRVNQWFCCALIASAVTASEAVRGENKFRTGEGGVWGNGAMWNPAGVPAQGDHCFQDTQATGELQFTGFAGGGRPALLSVTPGGSPARAFRVITNQAFLTDAITQIGTGDYAVTIETDGSFIASSDTGPSPGAIGGNWIVGEDGTLRVFRGFDLDDGFVELEDGAILLMTTLGGGIEGDEFDSRISLLGAGATVGTLGAIQVGILEAVGGSEVSCGVLEVDTEGSIDGATVNSSFLFLRTPELPDTGNFSVDFAVKNGAELNIGHRLAMHHKSVLQYEGVGNTINAEDVLIDSFALLQKTTGVPASQLTLAVQRDFNVATEPVSFVDWDASGIVIRSGGGTSTNGAIELTYGDYGGIFFVDVPCVSYAGLVIAESASTFHLTLTDSEVNAFRGDPLATTQDALYVVGDIIFEPGARLNTNGLNVYYTGALTADPNQIYGIGGEVIQVPALMFGDFDGDCDVDLTDFAVISQGFTGSGGLTHLPLTDGDCDRDTDLTDFAHFSQNFTGSGTGCGESLMGGGGGGQGGPSAAEAAAWCCDHLDRATRAAFAARIETVLNAGHEGADRDRLVELGRLLQ